jgi:predicted kinase
MLEIIVFFGMIASGKSTLASRFARHHDLLYLNTDRVRKELAGMAATERRPDEVGKGIYTAEFTRRTYETMLARTTESLAGGRGVVLDGSYSRRQDREMVIRCGEQAGADVRFIFCTCSDETVRQRLEIRSRDPQAVSDGRWEIYLHQKESFERPDELAKTQLLVLNTEDDPAILLEKIEAWRDKVAEKKNSRG